MKHEKKPKKDHHIALFHGITAGMLIYCLFQANKIYSNTAFQIPLYKSQEFIIFLLEIKWLCFMEPADYFTIWGQSYSLKSCRNSTTQIQITSYAVLLKTYNLKDIFILLFTKIKCTIIKKMSQMQFVWCFAWFGVFIFWSYLPLIVKVSLSSFLTSSFLPKRLLGEGG